MKKINDERIGQRYGRYVILSCEKDCIRLYYRCLCDCGAERLVQKGNLLGGTSKSCGCLPRVPRSHGYSHSADGTYSSWRSARDRCFNDEHCSYKDYGGRGIIMCDRWRYSFENFLADMGMRPSLQHSIDRFPDKNGNYEPGNCRWATRIQQARNTRKNRYVVFMGQSRVVPEWAEIAGIPTKVIRGRIDRGWSIERALTTIHISREAHSN